MKTRCSAFTLVELLISITVLALVIVLVARLFNSATTVTTIGTKRMDADSQARQLFERMSVDFSQMVKRQDLDYYLKSPANPQAGNDQIAFFAEVLGYYPSTGSQSPISLVSYRVNSTNTSAAFNKVERMAKGLVWNGVSPTSTPIVFLPLTISTTWPTATTNNVDSDYELIGPQVFRFEYYYLLRNGSVSDTPWDAAAGHTSVNGMQDVASIYASIAIVDPKSKVLLSDAQITALAGTMNDFISSMKSGELLTQWQSAVSGATGLPQTSISSIRLYERAFSFGPGR